MKKLLTILTIAAIASAPCMAQHFDGGAGAGDPSWFTAINWSGDTVPTSTEDTYPLDVLIGYGVEVDGAGAESAILLVGSPDWPGMMTVNAGGTFTAATHIQMADGIGTAKSGTLINNGTITTPALYMQAGIATVENTGTLNVNGGSLVMGNGVTATSTVSNTGTLTVRDWLYLSNTGLNSLFNMNGGTVNMGLLQMIEGGIGHLNLHGGTMNADNLGLNGNGGYTIEVTFGELIATGDHTAGLDYMISADLITSTGTRTPYSAYDAGANETTLGSIPEPATFGLLAILGVAFLRRK